MCTGSRLALEYSQASVTSADGVGVLAICSRTIDRGVNLHETSNWQDCVRLAGPLSLSRSAGGR